MKKKLVMRIMCGAMCAAMLMGGCGKEKPDTDTKEEEELTPHKKDEELPGAKRAMKLRGRK